MTTNSSFPPAAFSLEDCARQLARGGFETEIVPDVTTAGLRLREEIRRVRPRTVSYGDSLTVRSTGIVEELRQTPGLTFYDGFDPALTREENLEQRRQGLLADLFFTGINAISMNGHLHWLDMVGNRIAPICFGPKRVVLLAGKNKLALDDEAAWERIHEIAAPRNAARHEGFRTPCVVTGRCADCRSPQRICNARLTLDRCYPKGRILVILIEEEAGL